MNIGFAKNQCHISRMILAKMKSNCNSKFNARKKKTQSDIKRDRLSRLRSATPDGFEVLYELSKTVDHYFPDLWAQLDSVADPRSRSRYSIGCILLGSICLFLFKQESRNGYNKFRQQRQFSQNYRKIFGMNLPHMDTVNAVFKTLDSNQLERLKAKLVKQLLKKKVFEKFKLFGRDIQIVVDATRTHSFAEKHCDDCLCTTHTYFKLTKSGFNNLKKEHGQIVESASALIDESLHGFKALDKALNKHLGSAFTALHIMSLQKAFTVKTSTHYFHAVLEAKVVASNGFCISIATEWLCHTKGFYDKQDCELNAFKRLAKKMKAYFPRLPVCIIADGLYPSAPFFQICKDNSWRYIVTYKDGNLKSLRRDIHDLLPLNIRNNFKVNKTIKNWVIKHENTWIADLDYHDHSLSWVQCREEKISSNGEVKTTRFEYLTNVSLKEQSEARELINSGRIRQKIENEGFNIQKNNGFKLKHKYSRTSFQALKNYYQCLQIAHMIDQLCYLSKRMKQTIKAWGTTLKHCIQNIQSALLYGELDQDWIEHLREKRTQFRY